VVEDDQATAPNCPWPQSAVGYGEPVAALPPDYDSDPERWRNMDRSWQVFGDVHEPVAERLAARGADPVIDVGGGQGRLVRALPAGITGIVVDNSRAQLTDAPTPRLLADALHLPLRDNCAGAVTALWMLYHLDEPERAVAEAWRVLRPGGWLVASTSSRRNDPELIDAYPSTTFDAEEAEQIIRRVFTDVTVEHWDAPMTHLPDRDAVVRYCRSHHLSAEAADRVKPPVWLAKRGCLLYARR
jgi:SAM-dependent methyltransferase